MFRQDPGPCPICGAAHTACGADSGPITVVQLPARDALQAVGEVQSTNPPAELVADEPEPVLTDRPPFATGDYTRAKHGLPRRR